MCGIGRIRSSRIEELTLWMWTKIVDGSYVMVVTVMIGDDDRQ